MEPAKPTRTKIPTKKGAEMKAPSQVSQILLSLNAKFLLHASHSVSSLLFHLLHLMRMYV